jgi:hypothetical protein
MEWLREGERGRHIERVVVNQGSAQDFVHEALQQGALPSLKFVSAKLDDETQRESLTRGLLGGMHEMMLTINTWHGDDEVEPQLEALGLVRQLPALTKLAVRVLAFDGQSDEPVEWPPFIPASLKALDINVDDGGITSDLLLRALPGMLEASGARLERLKIDYLFEYWEIGDELVHVAQALRCCSPTLKDFVLVSWDDRTIGVHEETEDRASQVERMRGEWADVMAGVSACRDLKLLTLPNIKVEPLFPPGTVFARLTHLEICDSQREHPPDAGVMGLWELMASGGLPVLANLNVTLETRGWGGEEVRRRVAPAFEAAAGTLTHLHLVNPSPYGRLSDEVEVGYELGVAVGKLRRLNDLDLELSRDGVAYHAFAQGLAASGERCPLPLLGHVTVSAGVGGNAKLCSSLILRVCESSS